MNVTAGWTRNTKGMKVVALHIPGRKNRVLLYPNQFIFLGKYYHVGAVPPRVMSAEAYAKYRKSR